MDKFVTLIFFLFLPSIVRAQYDFEKFPAIKFDSHNNWISKETNEKVENSLTINNFYKNGESLNIQLNSFKDHWYDNSIIKILKNKTNIQEFSENIGFNPIAIDSVRVADFDGDGLKDLKLIVPYMGNGTASMNVKVIYLFQKANQKFLKVSFDDKQSENRSERDFNNDGKYEIITMQLIGYQGHSYFCFNLFNMINGKLVNVNNKQNYPILVQFLEKENFKTTDKISRKKMKIFTLTSPEKLNIKE